MVASGGAGTISAGSIAASIVVQSGVTLGGPASLAFLAGGNLATGGDAIFTIDDRIGGSILGSATIGVTATDILTNGNQFLATINNSAGHIMGDALLQILAIGDFSAGDVELQILNSDDGAAGTPGMIGGDASITLAVGGNLTTDTVFAFINDRQAGMIGQSATIGLSISGAMQVASDVTVGVSTRNDGNGGGTIGQDATVTLLAGDVNIGGLLNTFISTNGGGHIMGNATLDLESFGDLNADGGILAYIAVTRYTNVGNLSGGVIGGSASVILSALNIISASTASGIPGTDLLAIEASIYTNGLGRIDGNAFVDVTAEQNISAPGTIFFTVANGNFQNLGPGMIGGAAHLNVSAVNLFSGDLFAEIYNYGGASIGGDARIILSLGGQLGATGDVFLTILNGGGTIGGAANIQLNTNNLSAQSLRATIDNANGQVAANSTIDFNLSGDAMIANDFTARIFGNGAPQDQINFTGGNYAVGGTFLARLDGNGSITFDSVTVQADAFKAGALGPNGTLTISGGQISADTLLRLYAGGSNGSIIFTGNVTLNSQSTATIIAARTVTILDGFTVLIAGPDPALVFADIRNFMGSGGNNSTTGIFGGTGANSFPFNQAPPFDGTPGALTVIYTGINGGTWSNTGNWNPMVVPNNGGKHLRRGRERRHPHPGHRGRGHDRAALYEWRHHHAGQSAHAERGTAIYRRRPGQRHVERGRSEPAIGAHDREQHHDQQHGRLRAYPGQRQPLQRRRLVLHQLRKLDQERRGHGQFQPRAQQHRERAGERRHAPVHARRDARRHSHGGGRRGPGADE